MLCLNRKECESIHIGDDIVVTVERINGNRVQVSVAAPKEVKILRGELFKERDRNGESKSNGELLRDDKTVL